MESLDELDLIGDPCLAFTHPALRIGRGHCFRGAPIAFATGAHRRFRPMVLLTHGFVDGDGALAGAVGGSSFASSAFSLRMRGDNG